MLTELRRMLRSTYWVGYAAGKTAFVLAAVSVSAAVYQQWVAAAILLGLVPLALWAGLGAFRRAEERGKVADAAKLAEMDNRWFQGLGPIEKAGVMAVLVLALITAFLAVHVWGGPVH